MFLIPLNQPESVQLVIHALRVAGGVADCSDCPVRKVCMKQCLKIADSVQHMIDSGSLPSLAAEGEEISPRTPPPSGPDNDKTPPEPPKNGHLKIIK